jgi:hypothetical protein
MTKLTATLAILSLSIVGCASTEQPSSAEQAATRWSYSVDYLDHTDMSVMSSQSGTIGDGRQPLPVAEWQGITVSPEATDALGRTYRETTVQGQATPIMRVTCGVYDGVGQSSLTVGTRIAVLTVRCAD